NSPKIKTPKELTFADRDFCWKTALLNKQGNPVFPSGTYEIAVTVSDYTGNQSTEAMRVIVDN
ncbi:MAG: hypothetical protein JXA52_03775, partial [Planctomycetes bacterium]|nr:hypothetical protein [Planctomycetota bacterium]